MNELDISAKKREPKEAEAKFPPHFHKPKTKAKLFVANVCILVSQHI